MWSVYMIDGMTAAASQTYSVEPFILTAGGSYEELQYLYCIRGFIAAVESR